MNPDEYQKWCRRFELHEDEPYLRDSSLALGLCSEAGEVARLFERNLRRDPHKWALEYDLIKEELGDVLWNVARIADEFGYSLANIMEANVAKLLKRYEEKGIPLK